jgi:hypothetical protein
MKCRDAGGPAFLTSLQQKPHAPIVGRSRDQGEREGIHAHACSGNLDCLRCRPFRGCGVGFHTRGRCQADARRRSHRELRERLHARDGQRVYRRYARRMRPLTRAPKRARDRRRPEKHGCDSRELQRLLRRLQPRRRRRSSRSDLARLLPLAERRRKLCQFARSRLSGRHVAVRGDRQAAGPHGELRRSRDRVGRSGSRLLRLRELGRSGPNAENVR